jgi:hypothetical protein
MDGPSGPSIRAPAKCATHRQKLSPISTWLRILITKPQNAFGFLTCHHLPARQYTCTFALDCIHDAIAAHLGNGLIAMSNSYT